jgi:hypothetical protein
MDKITSYRTLIKEILTQDAAYPPSVGDGLATALVAAGVPKEDIVLAFYSPNKRRLTEFAVN